MVRVSYHDAMYGVVAKPLVLGPAHAIVAPRRIWL